MSASDKVDFIARAKAAGYFVRLFFVCTDDPTINAKRIALRVMEGGHDVPIPKIISRYTRSIVNCAEAARIADRTYLYDNTVDNASAKLLVRFAEGRSMKVYGPLATWAQKITSELSGSN